VELRAEIAERERVEERLKREVMHDALTGLPNRSHQLDRARRPHSTCGDPCRRRSHDQRAISILLLSLF
jgi:GGDEF domain-containing protein